MGGDVGNIIEEVSENAWLAGPIGLPIWAAEGVYQMAHDTLDMMEAPETPAAPEINLDGFYESQAAYLEQMGSLQAEQIQALQNAQQAGQVENLKDSKDYTQSNAEDVSRKQMLRRGLMSTYTRYGNNAGGGSPGKATKLGG